MVMKEVESVLIPGEEISVWAGKCYSIGFEFDVIKVLGMCERARFCAQVSYTSSCMHANPYNKITLLETYSWSASKYLLRYSQLHYIRSLFPRYRSVSVI